MSSLYLQELPAICHALLSVHMGRTCGVCLQLAALRAEFESQLEAAELRHLTELEAQGAGGSMWEVSHGRQGGTHYFFDYLYGKS